MRNLSHFQLLFCITLPIAAGNGAGATEPTGQVRGYYSHGSMVDSTSLETRGEGYIHLFEKSDRHYGSEGLIRLLTQSTAQMAELFPDGERLQVGEISARHGGFISGHNSHQNGLDMDLVFYRVDHAEQTPEDNDHDFIETFVKNGKLSPNFDLERNWAFIKLLVHSGRVQRIFVHTAIKNGLCRYAKKLGDLVDSAEALRRLQILDSHDDHMHVRLTCPPTSSTCEKQHEVPVGTGCPAN